MPPVARPASTWWRKASISSRGRRAARRRCAAARRRRRPAPRGRFPAGRRGSASSSAIAAFCSTSSRLTCSRWLIAARIANSSRTSSGARPNEGSSSSMQPRAQHQRARHGEHLLLAAGERARLLAAPLAQARKIAVHALEIALDRAAGRGARRRPAAGSLRCVRCRKVPRPSGTCATPMRTMSSVARPSMRSPAKRTSPSVRTIAQSARRVVVLPAPLAPSSAVIELSCNAKSMPCSTRVWP